MEFAPSLERLLTRLGLARPAPADVVEVLDAAVRVPAGLSRRAFLRTALVATTAAALVDVDQLLWTPGERRIFLPADEEIGCYVDCVTREALRILENQLTVAKYFNRSYDDAFVTRVRVRPFAIGGSRW